MAIAQKSKKPTTTAKKRVGSHHRQSHQYKKTYWPYLPMLLIVLCGIVFSSWLNRSGHVLGDSTNLTPSALLTATNSDRHTDNEAALSLNPSLMSAAQAKAENMAQRNYWSHDTPDGRTPWSFMTAAGYDYAAAGENLAYGFSSAEQVEAAWMASPAHRANILDSDYQDIGFGIAASTNYQNRGPEVIVVAMYAQPVSAAAHITFSVANPSSLQPTSTSTLPPSSLVSRLNLLPGGANPLTIILVSVLAGAAMAVWLIRHGLKIQRLLTNSERFVAHHPLFDCLLVFICTVAVVVTRTAGFIR